MRELLHHFISTQAEHTPDNEAISYRGNSYSYSTLSTTLEQVAHGLLNLGLARNDRVAIYLPKRYETVATIFGTCFAGGVFVPVNPLLKAAQVNYILRDCGVRYFVTSYDRAKALLESFSTLPDLHSVILVDADNREPFTITSINFITWPEFLSSTKVNQRIHSRIDADMAAILYTSGSTGKPKGVVLSHRNMVTGAKSVSQYLNNNSEDRILAVLPFSFDYGLSQLTTAFHVGASVVLMEYLFPRDVIKIIAIEKITGLAAVPPLWIQLAQLDWPDEAIQYLRYITNSGGALPSATITSLRNTLRTTEFYLMYGLTEAFRSTYLPPEQITKRPDSIGKAIPNAEIMVVRKDGTPCSPGEPGELVHRGSLVAMGYWNDKEKTAERFKPAPKQTNGLPLEEIAVWSGDTVRIDEEGFFYFIGRKDDMIKTSGYRVSPTEVEEVIYATELVEHVVAIGVPHPTLGQAVVTVVTPLPNQETVDTESILAQCKQKLPAFMVPAHVHVKQNIPHNLNGKIDRKQLASELQNLFQENSNE